MLDRLAYVAGALALFLGLKNDCADAILLGLAVLALGVSRWYGRRRL